MNELTAYVLVTFIFFGWIPILALGKAIVWCIEAIQRCRLGGEDPDE